MGVAKQIVDASKATLNSLENKLAGVLKPIPPRKEFVHTLGSQIQSVNHPTIIHRLTGVQSIFLVIAGVLSIGALLMIGFRAIFSPGSPRRRTKEI